LKEEEKGAREREFSKIKRGCVPSAIGEMYVEGGGGGRDGWKSKDASRRG
jgi:hypothetical protein